MKPKYVAGYSAGFAEARERAAWVADRFARDFAQENPSAFTADEMRAIEMISRVMGDAIRAMSPVQSGPEWAVRINEEAARRRAAS